jgi:hypothetical protein
LLEPAQVGPRSVSQSGGRGFDPRAVHQSSQRVPGASFQPCPAAIDVAGPPPALVRSGRSELWLETKLPDPSARTKIVEDHAAALPSEIGPVDVSAIAEATDGLTGADLKALMEDGKMLFAFHRARKRVTKPATDYFLGAIQTIRSNRQRYADAEAKIHAQRRFEGVTPPWMRGTPDVDGDEDVP